MKNICMHFTVTGRVQGVWYRANTQEKAGSLGLYGWVRNLTDGRVEVMACGSEDKISELHQWLWQGPQGAAVTDVSSEESPWQSFEGFDIITAL